MKLKHVLIGALAALTFAVIGFSARTDLSAVVGSSGSLRGVDVLRISSTGDLYLSDSASYTALLADSTSGELSIYNGDVNLGAIGTQPSTTNFYGYKIAIKNCGASAWVQGSLVVADPNAVGCGALGGATTDLTSWVGISEGAVAAAAIGYITVGGYALALTTGTVNRGDTLVSTTSAAGYLTGDTTPTTGADVGVALSSGTAAGGLTLVRVR